MIAGLEDRTDEELVERTRAGDDLAFEALMRRYQRRIVHYVAGMVGDHGRAEDITQEAFLSALRRLRRTGTPIAFRAWIHVIARNACIDHHRQARRTRELSLDVDVAGGGTELDRLTCPAGTLDDRYAAVQRLTDLRGAFDGLTDVHRRVLVLRELEGRSYREIGELLDLTQPAVESALFRARRRLASEYEALVSGERCTAVRGLHAKARLTGPERCSLDRHLAHCRPCRRHAHAA